MLSCGTGGNVGYGVAERLFNVFNILSGVYRELFPLGYALDIALPAIENLINGLSTVELGGAGEIGGNFAINFVADYNRNLIEIAENVDEGEGNVGSSLNHAAIAGSDQIKIANSAGTTGGNAVFVTCLAKLMSSIAIEFANECARANAGGISLNDGDNVGDSAGRNACSNGGEACQRRGRSGERIDAVVNIAQRAELTFHKNSLALSDCVVDILSGIGNHGLESVCIAHEVIEDFLGADGFFVIHSGENLIFILAVCGEALHQALRLIELADLETNLGILIGIEGSNARLGRAEALCTKALLFERIKHNMAGQQKLGSVRNDYLRIAAALKQRIVFREKLG